MKKNNEILNLVLQKAAALVADEAAKKALEEAKLAALLVAFAPFREAWDQVKGLRVRGYSDHYKQRPKVSFETDAAGHGLKLNSLGRPEARFYNSMGQNALEILFGTEDNTPYSGWRVVCYVSGSFVKETRQVSASDAYNIFIDYLASRVKESA